MPAQSGTTLSTLQLVERQQHMETVYSRQSIEKYVQKMIDESPVVLAKIAEATDLLNEWVLHDHSYKRADGSLNQVKNKRIAQLVDVDFSELVNQIMVITLPMNRPELYTAVMGQMANRLGYSDKVDGIKTIAEIIAVMGMVEAVIIGRGEENQLTIRGAFEPPQELVEFIWKTKYMPPMVCPPEIVTANHQTGYLSLKGSLILGKGNHHDECISLDVINKMNQTALSLDIKLLTLYQEMPKNGKNFTDPERQKNFDQMARESLDVYVELATTNNKFYLTHNKDKRGRTYAHGYHVNTQGTSFKKAIINFHNKEVIEGVY